MAFNPSGRKIGKELVTKLESRIRDLQAENKTFQRQIHDARSGADARSKYSGRKIRHIYGRKRSVYAPYFYRNPGR